MENSPPIPTPNWLVCASCGSAISAAAELVSEEIGVLRNAVYAYKLDMLDREVSVYSATNTSDHRFDVVRVVLSDDTDIPKTGNSSLTERESLRLFLRHFQVVSLSEGDRTLENPNQLVEELDRLIEQSNTSQGDSESSGTIPEGYDEEGSDPTDESPPKRRRYVTEDVCGRIETKFDIPTDEYSWFPSYSWTIASCKRCHEHLGWVFWQPQSDTADKWELKFVSLIVTKLREKFLTGNLG